MCLNLNTCDVFSMNKAQMSILGRFVSGKRITGATRSLDNARDLQLECARDLHETLFVPVLMFGIEIIL